ncbi:MAG TPA: hypothetical protein VFN97_08825, partial [Actinospica sp.]|nr:hypothetical protein [Actinospica sp.]
MERDEGGAAGASQEADGAGSEAAARQRAAKIAAQRAAADAAIAAVAGGKQALSAMTSASAAAAKSARLLENKRVAEREALEAEEQEAEEPAVEVEAEPAAEEAADEPAAEIEPEPEPVAPVEVAAPPAPEPVARVPRRRQKPAAAPTYTAPPVFDEAITRWLSAEGAPPAFAGRLRAEFGEGEDATAQLAENPWLVLEISGVQPAAADNLARLLLGIDARDKLVADARRSRALVGALLRRA